MPFITLRDGAQFYYKDWHPKDSTTTVVFSHGWPLSSDGWEKQMFFLASRGYRVIAYDRRGHGRSDQTWENNDVDSWADDVSELFEKLDLKNVVLVGHSTGGGEVARYCARRERHPFPFPLQNNTVLCKGCQLIYVPRWYIQRDQDRLHQLRGPANGAISRLP